MSRHSLWVGTNIADRYCITGEIGGGGMGRVYSAIPFADPSQQVAIKVIEKGSLDYEDVLRFQREAALMSRLRHPNIIAFHELGLYQPDRTPGNASISGYYIVMEVAQGHNLKESLTKGGRKGLEFFFQLGLQVSSALEYTHAKNIIHRDIKPQNIIIERTADSDESLLVKVLDFGIAHLTELDLYSSDDSLLDIAGTPLYMAPENSKYLDAPIDHRADLYSLGCMLYEVLAGRPPFLGNTREKLARDHAHAAPEPLTALRPDIPGIVNDIVMKLISKHPKDRYQTAFGLHVDLQRVRKILASGRTQHRFHLGRYDRLNILPSNMEMVGREGEFENLVSNYNAIAKENSRSRLAVIRGPAGTGKTRLLKEFRAYLARHRIRYISTSFSRHENNLPFNALANGFNEYLIHVHKTQAVEAEEIKRKVRTLLGPTASMVAQIVQGLKPYLDEEQEDENVRSGLEQEREFDFNDFAKAFSDFTRCLASDSEPVAFFFDDMQWADDKSLELIDRFFSHNNSQRFFLIIGHRPLGEDEGTNFQNFLAKFSKLRRRYSEIELATLNADDVARLNRSILNLSQSMDPEFLSFIQKKTGGNPLYLLELHRSLVTQELLSLDDQGYWRFNLDEIEKAEIQSSSIDLTLNRLNEMETSDRRVLEVAAIVGMHFTADALRVQSEFDDTTVMRVLQFSLVNGLVTRSQDPVTGSKNRAFAFTHRSIREMILDTIPQQRRCELHRLVALRLEQSPNEGRAQTIFTMAHHFHQALPEDMAADQKMVEKALVYNMRAGAKAIEVKSLLTAQRYYANARLLVRHWHNESTATVQAQKTILHSLADILFAQRDYAEAAQIYKELKQLRLNQMEYSYATYKLLHLSLVSGHVASTLRELVQAFEALKFPVIRLNILSYIKAAWVMFKAVVVPLPYSLPVQIMKQAEPVADRHDQQTFHPFLLYFIGQSAGFNYDKRLGLVYHTALLARCRKVPVPEDLALRLLCDHALILGFMGFKERAYQLLDMIHERAYDQRWESVLGYLSFIQTLIIDQYQGKFEDPRENLERMQKGLESPDFLLPAMQEKICRIFLAFTQAQGKELTRLIQSLPGLLTIRHWLTPRAVAMYLFWLLLSGQRDLIVSYRSFIEKRSKANNRRTDTFLRITESIVSFAAGEKDKARSAYYESMLLFHDDLKNPLLLPFEIDFVLLFVTLFHEVFAFEYGEELLMTASVQPTLQRLVKLAGEPRQRRRAIPILAVARLQEVMGGKEIKPLFDIALKRSKIMQQPLVELLTELWFGRHLFQERAVVRVDYVQKAAEQAQKLGLDMVVAMARKTARDLGHLTADDLTSHSRLELGAQVEAIDPLLRQHMLLLPQLKPDVMGLVEAKNKVYELLNDRLVFAEFHLITANDVAAFDALGRPPGDRMQQMIAYVGPYLNLRSSLTIPVGDAPWMQGQTQSVVERRPPSTFVSHAESGALPEAPEDVESTLVLSQPEPLPTSSGRSQPSEMVIGDRLAQRSMNTLVPIRYANRGLGVLFLERSRLQDEDSSLLRQLLDTFGAQMGIWLRSYLGGEAAHGGLPLLSYGPGSYHLESCPWLHVWTEGHLRSARESVWYLGINMSEQSYLVVYCRLNGPEDLRSPLASVLWHEMLVLRTLFSGVGRDQISEQDVQEAVERQFHSYQGIQNLESINLSFSIIHRQKGEVSSGHFGSARPMILGAANEVTPQNQVVIHLSNGRYLRYWKVHVSTMQKGVYILAHDSSKLDRLNLAGLKEQNFDAMNWEQKRWTFREYLKQNLIDAHMPRYFVAAAWNGQPTASQTGLDRAG